MRPLHLFFAVAIALLFTLRLVWLPRLNINWDEFLFLMQVHEFARGELLTGFQTLPARLFAWLPGLADGSIEQAIAARRVMFALGAATAAGVFTLGRTLAGATAGWFALLIALSMSAVLRHGDAFRADPMLAFLFITCAVLLVLRPGSPRAAAVAGAAWALAAVVSIKAVLYLPALALLLAAAGATPRPAPWRATAAFAGVAAAGWVALHAWHAAGLAATVAASAVDRAVAVAPAVWLQPRWEVLAETLARDWAFWILLAGGAVIAAREAFALRGDARRRALSVLALAAPVASVLVYRNGFDYFYVTLVPGAAVACGLAVARLEVWLRPRTRFAGAVLAVLAVPSLAVAASFYAAHPDDATAPQRTVLDAVHTLFPQPVPYIDRCGMVVAYPKVGPFMSSFVLARYRARATPVMQRLVATQQPVFVLANVSGLDLARPWSELSTLRHRLLREDFEYLQANYVHHWGPIWVAGRAWSLAAGDTARFDLPVPGRYTVESRAEVLIDGVAFADGDVLTLTAGEHSLAATGPGPVVLRYGARLARPNRAPPEGPLFGGL